MQNRRYHRQILLNEIGEKGQASLAQSSALLVGAGGLGSVVASLLVGGGIGTLTVFDDDCVDITNLHRQLFYTETDQGLPKVECLVRRLSQLNSEVKLKSISERVLEQNLGDNMCDYDIIIDATDNLETRILLAHFCQTYKIPYLMGAVGGFCGLVSLFSMPQSLRTFDDFLAVFSWNLNEEERAIVGTVTQIVGSVMANEVIKVLVGSDNLLVDKFWSVNMDTYESHVLNF
jgi:adenylyltransferase/sulfurtransferase